MLVVVVVVVFPAAVVLATFSLSLYVPFLASYTPSRSSNRQHIFPSLSRFLFAIALVGLLVVL
jgi:hypothetical protein